MFNDFNGLRHAFENSYGNFILRQFNGFLGDFHHPRDNLREIYYVMTLRSHNPVTEINTHNLLASLVFYYLIDIIILENYITQCYIKFMKRLMTRHFSKWAQKQDINIKELTKALDEIKNGQFAASLGGGILKKRIRFQGKGKSKSARTIICYRKGDRAIFIHGFAKNEKSNLSPKELKAFKELSKVLLGMTIKQINTAVSNGDFIEVIT